VKAPFFTTSVAVFQLRISAICRPGSSMPRRSSATAAVANSLRASRGGRLIQRVIASRPPGARRSRYAANPSTV
jgi:hypothetical protein